MTTTAIEESDTDALVGVSGAAVADAGVQATVVEAGDSDAVRTRVIQLRDMMSQGYFEMGRLLHRVSTSGMYLKWRRSDGSQYDSFEQYVEEEVEVKWRKARHLMSIWWWFGEEIGDPRIQEQAREIGWTKAAALVGVIDRKNADKWIRLAKEKSVKELDSEARMALSKAGKSRPNRPNGRSSGGALPPEEEQPVEEETAASADGAPVETAVPPETPEVVETIGEVVEVDESQQGVDPLTPDEHREVRTRWTVMLDGEQRKNVEHAVDCAVRIAELPPDSKGVGLDYVATGFLALHAGSGPKGDQGINVRNEMLAAMERNLGLDIIAFETGTTHAIFGEKTIDRLMAESPEDDETQS